MADGGPTIITDPKPLASLLSLKDTIITCPGVPMVVGEDTINRTAANIVEEVREEESGDMSLDDAKKAVIDALAGVGLRVSATPIFVGYSFFDIVSPRELTVQPLIEHKEIVSSDGITVDAVSPKTMWTIYEDRNRGIEYYVPMWNNDFGAIEGELIVLSGIVVKVKKSSGPGRPKTIRIVTGAVPLKEYQKHKISELKDVKLDDIVEAISWILDPLRSLGVALSIRGHIMVIDDPGTGKSTLIDLICEHTFVASDVSEAALVYNAKERSEGVLLKQVGGFVGLDEVTAMKEESLSILLKALDYRAVRGKGHPINVEHNCRFIITGNHVMDTGSIKRLEAVLSRMQWIGGALGYLKTTTQPELPVDVAEEYFSEIREKIKSIHLTEIEDDELENVTKITREIEKERGKEIREAFSKAVSEAISRNPPIDIATELEATDYGVEGISESVSHTRSLIRIRNIVEMSVIIELKGGDLEDTVMKVIQHTDTDGRIKISENMEGYEMALEAWKESLTRNYGQGIKTPPKSALLTPISPSELRKTMDEVY